MIFVAVVLPLLAYVAAALGMRRRVHAAVPVAAVLAAASLTALSAGWIVFGSPRWQRATQMAWVGLESAKPGDPLELGGPEAIGAIAWPTRFRYPELKVRPVQGNLVEVEILGGGAAVLMGDEPLNGTPLRRDRAEIIDGVAVTLRPMPADYWAWLPSRATGVLDEVRWWWGLRALILEVQGNRPVAAPLPRVTDRDRVVRIEALLGEELVKLRKHNAALLAGYLEKWAAGGRVFIGAAGAVRVVRTAEAARHRLTLPTRLRVRWPSVTESVELVATRDGRLAIRFEAPWHLSSPLPPERPGDPRTRPLTVAASLLPGEAALLLPFGGPVAGYRIHLTLVDERLPDRRDHPRTGSVFAPSVPGERDRHMLSSLALAVGPVVVVLATVRDLPGAASLLLVVVVGLLALGIGAAVALPRLRPQEAWTVGGLALVSWTLLTVRLLLALRYALDPAHLDRHAIDGVTLSTVALTVLPGVILVVTRLWRDQFRVLAIRSSRASAARELFAYVVVLFVLVLIQIALVRRFWVSLPAHLSPSLGWQTWALVIGFVVYVVLFVFLRYYVLPSRGFGALAPRTQAGLELLQLVPELFHRLAVYAGPNLWRRISVGTTEATLEIESTTRRAGLVWSVVITLMVGALPFAVLWALTPFVGGGPKKYLQEVAVPVLFSWSAAVLLLSAAAAFPPASRVRPRRSWIAALLALCLTAAPIFVVPLAVHDPGSIVAMLAMLLPTALLLSLLRPHPRAVAFVALPTALLAPMLAGLLYFNPDFLLPRVCFAGEACARFLAFKQGVAAQAHLAWLPLRRDDDAAPITVQSLSQSIQHTWENQAIAHAGEYTGLDFGNAPTRNSLVRQDTLQFDSTYSFFIVSEFGVVGGLLLLAVYVVPLALVLASGQRRLDAGHALAIVVAAALAIEAIYHAGMNLGLFPFTGRSLPLLAVNSNSDLLRWTLLLSLVTQALLWRATGEREGYRDASLLSSPDNAATHVDSPEPARRYWISLSPIVTLVSGLFLVTAWQAFIVAGNRGLSQPFTWNSLFAEIRRLAESERPQEKRKLWFDPTTKTIELAPEIIRTGGSLLEQERERFNALSENERLEGASAAVADLLRSGLSGLRTLRQYDNLLWDIWTETDAADRRPRPSLFRVIPPPQFLDEAGDVLVVDGIYRVDPNPDFNVRRSFRKERSRDDLPRVALHDQAAHFYLVRVAGIEFKISDRAVGAEMREVLLQPTADGQLKVAQDNRVAASRLKILLRLRTPKQNSWITRTLGEWEATPEGLLFFRGDLRLEGYRSLGGKRVRLDPGTRIKMNPGDRLQSPQPIAPGFQLDLEVDKTDQGTLIGPAWVRGDWVLAFDPAGPVPWVNTLARGLSESWPDLDPRARERLSTLTIDSGLQQAAQQFAATKGRELHAKNLAAGPALTLSSGDPRRLTHAFPPRVAVSVIDAVSGEVLALGGWPRVTPGTHWIRSASGESVPSGDWVDRSAPRSLRLRYSGDRNFDALVMGSAAKPLLAAAVLAVHPDLDRQLCVAAVDTHEAEVFGIPLEREWRARFTVRPDSRKWLTFEDYLSESDNGYNVRLGFLGLAERDTANGIATLPGESPSNKESLDGCKRSWHRYPRFPRFLGFGPSRPNVLRDLYRTELATRLRDMFGAGIEGREMTRRYSLWTANEGDDRMADGHARSVPLSTYFSEISPQAPNFNFRDVTIDSINSPRDFVSFLLGGATNLWANVDFAAAFATVVTGQPVTARVVKLPKDQKPLTSRSPFPEIARRLQPGLSQVIVSGTARRAFAGTPLSVLKGMQGVSVYAKTGTLSAEGLRDHSRMALALVRWDPTRTRVAAGLVITMIGERADMGESTKWMSQFVVQQEHSLRRLLGID